MHPGDVREKILEDHDDLRARIAQVKEAVHNYEESLQWLEREAESLIHHLCSHMNDENRLLVPALRAVGDEEKAAELLREHKKQRNDLRGIIDRLEAGQLTTSELSRLVRSLMGDIEDDMTHEEQTYLRRDAILANALEHFDDPENTAVAG